MSFHLLSRRRRRLRPVSVLNAQSPASISIYRIAVSAASSFQVTSPIFVLGLIPTRSAATRVPNHESSVYQPRSHRSLTHDGPVLCHVNSPKGS
ncbi:hypothetical protein EV356DRAFT_506844 [Viridothelium virens]|uniref:Uncharacterized protein n=1 Tax=Viridothelium virens TaxID=1048519 RepID=A0A6A6H063_VIRVR|nr:hypothetical protein EV356DRAFT_506844 [Viridothelium virens]